MRILYLTHYGILEPLGQTQILPYLEGLSRLGHSIDIVSFEKPHLLGDAVRVESQAGRLQDMAIRWFPRRYHGGRSMPGLLSEVVRTAMEVSRRSRAEAFDLFHCRAHVPYLMAWPAALLRRTPVLFDFRGFVADEYVDAGIWKPGGLRFGMTKLAERLMLRHCSALVVLTRDAATYCIRRFGVDSGRIFVIPCCTDLSRFRTNENDGAVLPGKPLRLVYAGSVTGRYRMAEMVEFFLLLRRARPGSTLTVLSGGEPSLVQRIAEQAGAPPQAIEVMKVDPSKVPGLLSRHDAGLVFLRGGLGLIAGSPTKLGEYLASGLAVVAEEAIGGIREILVDSGAGCLIDSSNRAGWPGVLERLLQLCAQPDFRTRSRGTAARFFALPMAVQRYDAAYRKALETTGRRLH